MITIFTPTYNRAYTLNRLFNSLINQSNKNFEWLIVDDGSNDNTKELVEKFKKKSDFPIYYYYKKNEGKHIAINFGSEKANGEWFFIVDSDDYLVENSIEIIYKYCNQIKENPKYAGVAGSISHSNGEMIGNGYNKKVIDLTCANFRKKYSGDKAEVLRTSLLKQYKFPQFNGEKFMQESVLWYSLSNDNFLFRWFDEIIYIADYIDDGLTKNGRKASRKSPLSKSYAENHIVGSKNIKFVEKMKSCINYYRYGVYGGKKFKYLFSKSNNKVLTIVAIPIAKIYAIKE